MRLRSLGLTHFSAKEVQTTLKNKHGMLFNFLNRSEIIYYVYAQNGGGAFSVDALLLENVFTYGLLDHHGSKNSRASIRELVSRVSLNRRPIKSIDYVRPTRLLACQPSFTLMASDVYVGDLC